MGTYYQVHVRICMFLQYLYVLLYVWFYDIIFKQFTETILIEVCTIYLYIRNV